MKYLIDKAIEFNTDDGTLHYPASQDVIKLTLPAARLLEEFLASGGRDLTREYLLETVWDKHGLQASGNNLNQYVSILRRNLALLECHELIVTLPKVGFKLNTAVSVEPLADTPPEKIPPPVTPGVTDHPVQAASYFRHIAFLLLSVAILAGMVWGIWRFYDANNGITEIQQPDTGCEVIYLKDIPDEDKPAVLERVGLILKANNLQCKKNNMIIYNNEGSYSSKNNARTLLSLCSVGKKKEVLSCDNFYHYKWVKP
ncbi:MULTISPECIES: winged helix-turn-helix domain-containing protein [Rahnella]|uniref:winged helix-turn-helix domain-containing protein n=1 Tax=Rahnella TaxID=34037 RepID=UPI00103BB938|nr:MULTISPECIES: helix-turn-helix domain-containing protein [Rahnella]TBX32917.1 helix-turn-helix domain-containing protein [Rahnella victoriana]TDS97945.1 DNA-binding winged helix-turn-helix (wHTH) protein [Rahnella sp. BIGb0236]